jgi:NADH-quinone oxidoreductase subunit I
MYGKGILKGLGVTLKHFFETYTEDIRYLGKRYIGGGQELSPELMEMRQRTDARGLFTIQYPEEKRPMPENFRFLPFIIYDESPDDLRCTACGICARNCPPQCIWIVRASDPETGKSLKKPGEFVIDAGVCMSCGICAEVCPFDAIKMDHDYEIASYERADMTYTLDRLLKPASYHVEIHPSAAKAE